MTYPDDDLGQLRLLDRAFEQALAGGPPPPDAPAWCDDLARLVDAARRPAAGGELAAEADVVEAMVRLRTAGRAPGDGVPRAVPPLVPGSKPTVTEDSPARAGSGRHGPDGHRPRHAAPPSRPAGRPAARGVARLLAVKATAIATAAVIGTVAAAAATTGLVAKVVVPALTDDVPSDHAPPATTTTTTDGAPGPSRAGGDEPPAPASGCPATARCAPGPAAGTGSPTPATPTPSPGPADG
ncbi:MAG TPA: hypothetical protein VFW63_11290, partial [Acidimicrobiales bacterium]|nr:hypothetical protein [Acidimicrobiales bacterium]